VFRNITEHDITAFAIHPLKRKFVVGTADGRVLVCELLSKPLV
jgi:hypothetical protein